MDHREDRIRHRAYLIWEREGRPQGWHLRHWYLAIEEMEKEAAPPQLPSRPAGDKALETEWATQATIAPSSPPLFGGANRRE
jgi:hypothetical protein